MAHTAIHVGTPYPTINGLTPCPTIKWHMAHTAIHVGTPYPTINGLTPCRKQLIGTWTYLWVRNVKYIHSIVIHVEYLYNEYNQSSKL